MSGRVEVCTGDGLVARRGGTIVAVSGDGSPGRDRILGLVDDLSGEGLIAAVANALAELGTDAPSALAIAVVEGERREVLAWGAGEVRAHVGDATHTVAADGVVPARQALAHGVDRARIAIAGAGAPVPGSDLAEGVVPGGAAEMTLAPLGAPLAPPPPLAGLSVVPLDSGSTPAGVLAGLEPLPVDDTGAIAPSGDRGPRQATLVPGARCPRDHHNNPAARFCHRCGIRMGAHRSLVIVTGPRPPLGVLVLDDGSTFPVVSDAVIGREPAADALVQQGAAEPLALEDPDRLASRAHARLILEDWSVRLEDRGSINGTWIRRGDEAWRRLEPNERLTLVSGSRVRIGGRELLFEHHHEWPNR